MKEVCPKHGEELKVWYGLGGRKYLGCPIITCNYKREIK